MWPIVWAWSIVLVGWDQGVFGIFRVPTKDNRVVPLQLIAEHQLTHSPIPQTQNSTRAQALRATRSPLYSHWTNTAVRYKSGETDLLDTA